jgi:hypothetical protein
MGDLKQRVMDYSIRHWHEHFTGISGLEVAERLNVSHERVLRAFDELEREGKGFTRRDVTLYQLSKSFDGPKLGEAKPVVTHIFFPAQEVLAESFYSSTLCRSNIPEYKARLHKGGSQVRLVYFSSEVLTRYLEHIEIFEVEDSVTGGYICSRQEDQDSTDFPLLRFGKRHLSDGTLVVTAILWDLSELPEKEQAYWRSYELKYPCFATQDTDFTIFYRRDFEAEFLDDNDPLQNVLTEIGKINGLLESDGLFAARNNPYLSYPSVNTYKAFSDSCSELYKLVGPDSLQERTLRDLLTAYLNYQQQDFLHPKTGRPLGKMDLFKRLCVNLGCGKLPPIIERIGEHRISADHRVISPKRENKDYLAEFRILLQELYEGLCEFRTQVERRMEITDE